MKSSKGRVTVSSICCVYCRLWDATSGRQDGTAVIFGPFFFFTMIAGLNNTIHSLLISNKSSTSSSSHRSPLPSTTKTISPGNRASSNTPALKRRIPSQLLHTSQQHQQHQHQSPNQQQHTSNSQDHRVSVSRGKTSANSKRGLNKLVSHAVTPFLTSLYHFQAYFNFHDHLA